MHIRHQMVSAKKNRKINTFALYNSQVRTSCKNMPMAGWVQNVWIVAHILVYQLPERMADNLSMETTFKCSNRSANACADVTGGERNTPFISAFKGTGIGLFASKQRGCGVCCLQESEGKISTEEGSGTARILRAVQEGRDCFEGATLVIGAVAYKLDCFCEVRETVHTQMLSSRFGQEHKL